MQSFAYYRLPYSDTYSVIRQKGEPKVLAGYDCVGKEEGFVIAPFAVDEATPLVLIKPDIIEKEHIDDEAFETKKVTVSSTDPPTSDYMETFSRYREEVSNGTFRKLVLARSKVCDMNDDISSEDKLKELFLNACNMYPRLMVMLFSTPTTGTWIIATPEVLITKSGDNCRTMALAGTMPYKEGVMEWSQKNKDEQNVVERYIEGVITPFAKTIVKDGPATSRAGNLVHLRTEFRFRLKKDATLGSVVSHLHPTPAVCGVPTEKARQFIIDNEKEPRRYYSGFAGPVGIDGETNLYVSLRCAELSASFATLYAGGGIMAESTCESEWHETESKMETVGKVIFSS